MSGYLASSAEEDGRYRYSLHRRWSYAGPPLVYLMLNPSTADGLHDDPTIESCVRIAKGSGYGAITVVNLFAIRSTNPIMLADFPDPIGPLNDKTVKEKTDRMDVCMGWGTYRPNTREWMRRHGIWIRLDPIWTTVHLVAESARIYYTKLSGDGRPYHPLYQKASSILRKYERLYV